MPRCRALLLPLRRPLLAALLASLLPTGAAGAGAPLTAVAERLDAAAVAQGTDETLRHQLRNHRAMLELVEALPVARRPQRLLYLAAGSHLAPLVLCEALPAGAPCSLRYTEIDAAVQDQISSGLKALAGQQVLNGLSATAPIVAAGERAWRFTLDGHRVDLHLLVTHAAAGASQDLLRPDDLGWAQLIISHDWSGDPIENLRVIRALLHAARALGPATVPLLMIEDLERHPYPIDLFAFTPLAHTAQPYGHRRSSSGATRHDGAELGEALYGGGVLLACSDRWWQQVAPRTVDQLLDLLLLSRFDGQRQNVLEGGEDPLLAPAVLDWWSGFGERSVRGDEQTLDRHQALAAALSVAPLLAAAEGDRLACLVLGYRSLLEARVAGLDERQLLPSATLQRRPQPGAFPSPAMEQAYRRAMRHAGELRRAQTARRQQAADLLEELRQGALLRLSERCGVARPPAEPGDGDAWAATYRAVFGL